MTLNHIDWIDNCVIAIVRQEVDEQLDYQQGTSQLLAKQKPAVNFMIFIRRLLASLYPV